MILTVVDFITNLLQKRLLEFFTSNLLGYNAKKSLVPITGNVNSQFLPTTPVECKLFDLSGKIISISYIVNPNINLFDSNLPYGILIAVPVENYRSFRTYNHNALVI